METNFLCGLVFISSILAIIDVYINSKFIQILGFYKKSATVRVDRNENHLHYGAVPKFSVHDLHYMLPCNDRTRLSVLQGKVYHLSAVR